MSCATSSSGEPSFLCPETPILDVQLRLVPFLNRERISFSVYARDVLARGDGDLWMDMPTWAVEGSITTTSMHSR